MCTNYPNYCRSPVPHGENCHDNMEQYFRYKKIGTYICPTCSVSAVLPFSQFYTEHFNHLTEFKKSKRTIILDINKKRKSELVQLQIELFGGEISDDEIPKRKVPKNISKNKAVPTKNALKPVQRSKDDVITENSLMVDEKWLDCFWDQSLFNGEYEPNRVSAHLCPSYLPTITTTTSSENHLSTVFEQQSSTTNSNKSDVGTQYPENGLNVDIEQCELVLRHFKAFVSSFKG